MNKSYNIHEKWTDLDKVNNVEINSVDGVIESIFVNGEPAGGGGGGGGDFTTANVTVNDPNERALLMEGAFPVEGTFIDEFPFINFVAYSDEFGTRPVALYKGSALIKFENEEGNQITASGNAEVLRPNYVKVTGDCTITIS